MRDIFRLYEEYPEMLEQTMKVGWTQNVVIMEARYGYLLAVQGFGWFEVELTKQIAVEAHLENIIEEEVQSNEGSDTPASPHRGKTFCGFLLMQ